jgi:hypothetical protein
MAINIDPYAVMRLNENEWREVYAADREYGGGPDDWIGTDGRSGREDNLSPAVLENKILALHRAQLAVFRTGCRPVRHGIAPADWLDIVVNAEAKLTFWLELAAFARALIEQRSSSLCDRLVPQESLNPPVN